MTAASSGCASATPEVESGSARDEALCAGDPNRVPEPRKPSKAEVEGARIACAAGDSTRCLFYFEHVGWDPLQPCVELADGMATEFLVLACGKKESAACSAAATICDSPAYRAALNDLRGELENRCIERDAQACALGSMIHDMGIGVERDSERFLSLASSACESGDADRCSFLALLGARGKLPGIGADRALAWNQRAARLWAQGCSAGVADDCFDLGSETIMQWTYGPGFAPAGIPQDLGRGLALIEKACPGQPVACFTLAELHESGTLVKRDPARAAAWYRRACDAGIMRACNDLGRLHALGLGVTRDCGAARALFQKTCDAGSRVGCSWLRSGVAKAMSSLELD